MHDDGDYDGGYEGSRCSEGLVVVTMVVVAVLMAMVVVATTTVLSG